MGGPGRPNISPYVKRMGVDLDGAFAEYVIRPEAALIKPRAAVPPAVLAVLTDAVATPLHGLKRVAHLAAGETLVVLGIGGLGSNAVQLGKAFGARVIAVTRSEAKLRLARELGADETVAADDGDPVMAVRALTGGHGPDVVIQCVGSAAVDEQAIAMGGPGGRVVLIGSSLDHFRARAVDIFWRELSVLGSRGFVPDDIRDAIDLYLDGTLVRGPPGGHGPAARGGRRRARGPQGRPRLPQRADPVMDIVSSAGQYRYTPLRSTYVQVMALRAGRGDA